MEFPSNPEERGETKDSPSRQLSPLAIYMRDIRKIPLLSAEEEAELGRRKREGDSAARDCLIRSNLRLVAGIARHYTGRGIALPDLIEEGNVGLLRAVEEFDERHGCRFCTYATYWIKQAILAALAEKMRLIRVPRYMIDFMTKWRSVERRLQAQMDGAARFDDIADDLGLSKRRRRHLRHAVDHMGGEMRSLDAQDTQQDHASLHASPNTQREVKEETLVEARDAIDHLLSHPSLLDEREKKVLRARFGLENAVPRSLSDIGEELNLTKERIRQIERDALKKLREAMGE